MRQKILSETDFDSDDLTGVSADNHLESHRTLDKKAKLSRSKKAAENSIIESDIAGAGVSGTPVMSGGVTGSPDNEGLVGARGTAGVEGAPAVPGTPSGDVSLGNIKNPDQVNNLTQKQAAMARAGVTREKTYVVIAKLLDAKKWGQVTDSQGNVKWEETDDLDKQKLGADMALKAFGDMVERKEIEVEAGDNLLAAYRGMSVKELKARAAELLLGKKSAMVTEAEIIK